MTVRSSCSGKAEAAAQSPRQTPPAARSQSGAASRQKRPIPGRHVAGCSAAQAAFQIHHQTRRHNDEVAGEQALRAPGRCAAFDPQPGVDRAAFAMTDRGIGARIVDFADEFFGADFLVAQALGQNFFRFARLRRRAGDPKPSSKPATSAACSRPIERSASGSRARRVVTRVGGGAPSFGVATLIAAIIAGRSRSTSVVP